MMEDPRRRGPGRPTLLTGTWQFFSTVALPIDRIILGENISVREIGRNAKNHPLVFALEVFAFVMMVIGVIVTCRWAYAVGKAVGSAIV